MDIIDYARFLAALAFVLALILGAAWLARKSGWNGLARQARNRDARRLAIIEVLTIDARRRLVLIRRDDREHLILTGPNNDTLVEGSLGAALSAASDASEPTSRSSEGHQP